VGPFAPKCTSYIVVESGIASWKRWKGARVLAYYGQLRKVTGRPNLQCAWMKDESIIRSNVKNPGY